MGALTVIQVPGSDVKPDAGKPAPMAKPKRRKSGPKPARK